MSHPAMLRKREVNDVRHVVTRGKHNGRLPPMKTGKDGRDEYGL
jgi:hypothetical protein